MSERGFTVLYAEDDKEDIMLFKEALFSYNEKIELILASNGKEVLQLLKNGNPDLVFLDINMPLMDGLKCLKSIRSLEDGSKEIPIALISTSNVMKDKAMNLGATFYFTKPVDQDLWNKIFDEVFSRKEILSDKHR
jgi:CheY-like chemotaxis protein